MTNPAFQPSSQTTDLSSDTTLSNSPELSTQDASQYLAEIFKLAGIPPSETGYSTEVMEAAFKQLKQKLATTKHSTLHIGQDNDHHATWGITHTGKEYVMVIGLLGVINYQIKTMLKKRDYEVTIVKTPEEAIEEFQKNDYRQVIIDLFMPSEREGFAMLEEIKKIAALCNIKFNIVVLSNPTNEQKRLEAEASIRGADFYVVRNDGWQHKLTEYFDESKTQG